MSPPLRWRATGKELLRLSRSNMTVFSAVTYLCASLYATQPPFRIVTFLLGYVFVFSCQLSTHFLGEYYDSESDRLNRHASVLTGGSKVLSNSSLDPRVPLFVGYFCSVVALAFALWVLPARVRSLSLLMLFLAHQYSATPLCFNHRALGELVAAIVTNWLLADFGFCLQSPSDTHPARTLYFRLELALLIVPPALIKFATFLVLNLADRRADWQGGKITLPVILGDDATAKLHAFSVCSAYIFALLLTQYSSAFSIRSLLLLLLTIPLAVRVCRRVVFQRGYRLTDVVALSLLFAPASVWLLLLNAIFTRLFANFTGPASTSDSLSSILFVVAVGGLLLWLQTRSLLKLAASRGRRRAQTTQSTADDQEVQWRHEASRVIIIGGGIGGLTLGACLEQLGVPYTVLERRSEDSVDEGADLALWPSAVRTLKALGLTDKHFWEEHTYAVSQVEMRKLPASVPDSNVGRPDKLELLKLIDMDDVVRGSGEHFLLVSRVELMRKVRELVPSSRIRFDFTVAEVAIDEEHDDVVVSAAQSGEEITGRLVVGADGAYSLTRKVVAPEAPPVRFCDEVCYRGVVDRPEGDATLVLPERRMVLTYGRGLRYSIGRLIPNGQQLYWFVKQSSHQPAKQLSAEQRARQVAGWPGVLRQLYEQTSAERVYTHSIEDAPPLRSWSHRRVVLLGDAAHPVTPNMGQGACMAIDDALALAVLLRKYIMYADGHVEAFYLYERRRKGHAAGVAAESRMQLRLAQLSHHFGAGLRDTILRIVPPQALQKKLRNVNMVPIDDLLADFEEFKHERKPLLTP